MMESVTNVLAIPTYFGKGGSKKGRKGYESNEARQAAIAAQREAARKQALEWAIEACAQAIQDETGDDLSDVWEAAERLGLIHTESAEHLASLIADECALGGYIALDSYHGTVTMLDGPWTLEPEEAVGADYEFLVRVTERLEALAEERAAQLV